MMKYNDTWDLEAIFPGGTKSAQLQEKINSIKTEIKEYEGLIRDANLKAVESLQALIDLEESISRSLRQVGTFITMYQSAYMDDEYAGVVMGQAVDLMVAMEKQMNRFIAKLVEIDHESWQALLETDELQAIAFRLNEKREDGKRLRTEEEEEVIAELKKDGITAWSQLYDKTVGIMTIPFTDEEGVTSELSVGQAMNRMYADPDANVRAQLFEQWEKAWAQYGPIFSHTLNHLAGSRLTLQKLAKRKDHLEEPLELNRMTKATLRAMWGAIEKNKEAFLQYLDQKARLLGMEQLNWQDVDAPISVGDYEATKFTYDEAADFILEHFSSFGEELTSFTKYALMNRWVEAENRPNKRPGGYCASLPEDKESRIFMTFTGSANDVSTLAHELGHAFHSYVLRDVPYYNQQYAMNVAETASTFAELIIQNATIEAAKSDEEKISLLATKLESATAMFLNIHARFLFEDSFYEERKEGFVAESRLNELMEAAQKEAYGNRLASYHPQFWSSKLHFFIENVPFYNFPYTFGYLFSLGIYAAYKANPNGFEEKYIALLRDTGSMNVEDLAKKHLAVDMTDESFWTAGIELMIEDVEEFIKLTKKL